MKRRESLKVLAAAPLLREAALAQSKNPIQLHVDLEVDPAKEKELHANYTKIFRPAITKQPGFVEVKLMKLRNAVVGKPPAPFTHRLVLSFQTEEQRQKWVATDLHQKVWPEMEKTMKGTKYGAVLYDIL
jgi:heme-degrading monooxygenase HmoA